MLSYVQNQILTLFLRSEELRYSDAKPEGIDNDLFNYHLKFLLDKGYIRKGVGNKYSLTEFGKKYVQRIDVLGEYKKYFRFSIIAFVTKGRGKDRKLFVQKRLRHPYYGDMLVGISGKVNPAELIEEAASRSLKQETGLICDSFKLIGVQRKIRRDKKGNLIEDTLYHCCVGQDPSGKLIKKNNFGEHFWMDFDEAASLQKQNMTYSPNDIKMIERLQEENYDFFYWQEEVTFTKF